LFRKPQDSPANSSPKTPPTNRQRSCWNWLKDEALEESANLPAPEIIAQEINDDLEAALEQFATIAEDVKKRSA
jgi:hypothetical protein